MDVTLVCHGALLVITEQARPDDPSTVLRIPLARCAAARIAVEPGLLGAELLQLTLTVRLGRIASVDLPLWFPAQCRTELQRFVDEVTARAGAHDRGRPDESPRTNEPPGAVLEPLTVRRAPDDHDWIAFQDGDNGEVLRVRDDGR
ncbi:hypothetical protein BB31_26225 [Amycolatopsis lurida NRRL 2430]|uniref:Uncharacterized protein n=1 Tax=Amycolatopsis lurida NRRL 2430 TaxID=1460371 RepID=A0A2P2FNW4_AMYLU|nr:hypothetical protein [Amycolatopsis lurida]KFU78405.1 hypothetical protein BB31_26225 [Amycolatopsis lurida NRRL 2430]